MKDIFLRINQYLLFSVLFTVVLYYGKVILVPLFFGTMLAMLMAPVCRRLDRKGVNRAVSCTICTLILLIAILFILVITIKQLSVFLQDLPRIEEKAAAFAAEAKRFIKETFNMPVEKQQALVEKQAEVSGQSLGTYLGKILGGFTATVAGTILTLVYTFLFLYNKEKYERFFLKLYKEQETAYMKNILSQIVNVAEQYLTGRVLSIIILTVLYYIGLAIIGVKSALLLSGIAALLTIVPYVGSTIGGFFPFLMAVVTEDSIQPAIWVVVVIVVIQAIDNYFIEPRIVGGEVNLSPLATILIIIIGGVLWGVAGMILFIPMLGIAKIIFDHIESLKPMGYLIGDSNGKNASGIKKWITENLNQVKKSKKRN